MKKILRFFSSMKFGMILLIIIMLLSLAGSLITQQGSSMTYVNEYGAKWATVLIYIGFTDIFHAWYFYALEALLAVNLIACSIVRFPKALKRAKAFHTQQPAGDAFTPIPGGKAEALRGFLAQRRFRTVEGVFVKNRAGFFGSFFVHLSILVILAFGGALLAVPVNDVSVMPGETLQLDENTSVRCDSFHIMNDADELDYASVLHAESADGTSLDKEIRVNEPMRFGEYKIYQFTYGTAGRVRITNNTNGGEDTFYLTEEAFLSIDGKNGIWFSHLYPGFIKDEDGNYTLITGTSESYEDPVYDIRSIVDGMSSSVLAFPGESITIGDVTFTFLEPAEYPGLRIKHVSDILYIGLYTGFGLMVAALWLCFFAVPVAVHIREEDGTCAIVSPKDTTGLLTDMEAELEIRD